MLVHKRRSIMQKDLLAQTLMLLQKELRQQSCQANLTIILSLHLQSLNH